MRTVRLLAFSVAATLALCPASDAEPHRPGQFDYYVLVLGWAPSYCATEGRKRRDRHCAAGVRRAFTLHGLWPQYTKGWPEDCSVGKRPWVPQSVIDEMRHIMPSKNLVIHEYRAHGHLLGPPTEAVFRPRARAL